MTHETGSRRMRRSGDWVFVFALVVAIAVAFVLTASASKAVADLNGTTAGVTADKLDYVPGESVSIFGKNWNGGETVTLFVNDDETMTWARTAEVTASADGTFEYSFSLPEWFVANYMVTATGSSGSVALTQFTDIISRIGYSSNNNGAGTPGSSQLTLNAPPVTVGNVLVANVVAVAANFSASDTICAPPGWTSILRTDAAGGTLVIETFLRVVTQAAGNESHTWQFKTTSSACGGAGSEKSAGASGGMIRYTGVDTGHPLDVDPLGGAGLGTTATAPRLYTVSNSTRIVRFFGASKSGINFPAGKIYQVGSDTPVERTAASYDGPLTPAGSTNIFPAAMGTEATWGAQTIALRMAVAPTSISEVSGSGTYGGTATLTAKLDSGATNLSGKTVTFTLNGSPAGSAVTDSGGIATISVALGSLGAGAYPAAVTAEFAGDGNYDVSSGSGPLTITILDSTAPTTTDNADSDWHNSQQTITLTSDDGTGSGVASTSYKVDTAAGYSSGTSVVIGAPSDHSNDGIHTIYYHSTDNVGNVESPDESATVKIDTQAPSISCNAASFLLNQPSAHVSATVTDQAGLSGPLNGTEYGDANTSSVGSRSVSITGYDNAGNYTAVSCSYTVGYGFDGLYAPVDKPNTLNVSKAGQAIPLRWRLTDYYGAPVLDLSSVTVTVGGIGCSLGTSTDLLEEVASGSSGLQNLGNGYYQYNWKTPTSYAGLCKTLNLKLGAEATRNSLAYFSFKR